MSINNLDPVYIKTIIDINNISNSIIFTGSFSNNKLIKRQPNDIDIIVNKNTLPKVLKYFNSKKSKISYKNLFTHNHIAFIQDDYDICIFKNKDYKYSTKIINSNSIKLHDPLSILFHKVKLSKLRDKDQEDINEILINTKDKDTVNNLINKLHDNN